jgi:hypothetical protein
LAVSLADAGSSRRSLLARLVGVGLAAIVAMLGIGGLSVEDADARRKGRKGRRKKAKSCAQRCKRKGRGRKKGGGKGRQQGKKRKQACLAKCNKAPTGGGGGAGTQATPGFPIDNDPAVFNTSCTIGGAACVSGVCAPLVPGATVGAGVCAPTCGAIGDPACPGGTTCVGITNLGIAGVCLPDDFDVTGCTTGADCSTGSCVAGVCLFCDTLEVCGSGADAQCCVVEAECISGTCAFPPE